MIAVADLLKDQRLPGNYFVPDAYIKGDFESGLLENRRGDRLLALPETLIQGIYAGLEQEVGEASGVVLFNCGRWWGKNYYARMALTEAVSSDQFSFEDRARLLHPGKTLGSAFRNPGFCPMRTQGNKLVTDDIEQGSVKAMTVFTRCLSQVRSELIELLSSSLQGYSQGRYISVSS